MQRTSDDWAVSHSRTAATGLCEPDSVRLERPDGSTMSARVVDRYGKRVAMLVQGNQHVLLGKPVTLCLNPGNETGEITQVRPWGALQRIEVRLDK